MIRALLIWFSSLLVVSSGAMASTLITKAGLESQYGPIQGQMVMEAHTVILFKTVRVEIRNDTGVMNLQPIKAQTTSIFRGKRLPSAWMELKRKIARLPAHEQVRYWKLQQIRQPGRDVTPELEAALDKMEEIRKEALAKKEEVKERSEELANSFRRSRGLFSTLFPSFGYRNNYRYSRSLRRDAQIGLDRIYRPRRSVESWNTPMSMADRARSDALSLVSGARSANMGNTR